MGRRFEVERVKVVDKDSSALEIQQGITCVSMTMKEVCRRAPFDQDDADIVNQLARALSVLVISLSNITYEDVLAGEYTNDD